MQPHSMCALALASYYWNLSQPATITGCTMSVDYQTKGGKYKSNKYILSNIQESTDRRELKVHIMRGGGGIACTITIRRNTLQVGASVVMTHSQQHIAGLREEFRLMRKSIVNGQHYNSRKYRRFEGEAHADGRAMTLRCEIKKDDGSFTTVPYSLKITGIF
ncbi:MAG: hypothetical protein GF390_01765 [Candidatus Pacebacteria bacterium]|nr:hypothetical protein [Candidatus Paceibacterota bacterium]